jgi:GNAT superfamily N-acetyltransferase
MTASLAVMARRLAHWPLVHWMDRRLAFPDRGGEPDIGFLADDSRHFDLFARWLYAQWSVPRGETLEHRRRSLFGQMNLDRLPIALIAYWQGRPAGIVSLRPDDLRSRPELFPWLSALYVDPDRRGHGIGRALVRATLDLAAWLGYPRVFLFTTDRQSLYAEIGWQRLPSLPEEAILSPSPDVFTAETR